jgi:outer membrane protein OmpA-like peptidoglycan-associated protein
MRIRSVAQLLIIVIGVSFGLTIVHSQNDGQSKKMRLRGVVVEKEGDSLTVRDIAGADTRVVMNERTRFGNRRYSSATIVRGLNVDIQARTLNGQTVAERIRFSEKDLRRARSIELTVAPVENRVETAESRVGQVEQNATRMSGQLQELASISNAARGGARMAHATADAALTGVGETNERLGALDQYVFEKLQFLSFTPGSAKLTPEAKTQLDEVAKRAGQIRGLLIDVRGFADSSERRGNSIELSEARANNVVQYLVENHRIPIRRIITPYGHGARQPVADNRTERGRSRNRRVELRMYMNRALTVPPPVMRPEVRAETR